ncbi:MAG: hypothetical protein ACLR4Z_04395 [Butyricicoccaceae bacterium]
MRKIIFLAGCSCEMVVVEGRKRSRFFAVCTVDAQKRPRKMVKEHAENGDKNFILPAGAELP